MDKDIAWKWKWKQKTVVATLILDKIYFKKKDCNKKHRRALHNDKVVNPTRGYDICKYLWTNVEETKYIKQILREIKGETDSNTIVGNFNIPLTSMDTDPDRNTMLIFF